MNQIQQNETPMMRQFNELKKDHPDKILFFRMGDFYEMFGDDAVKAAKILQIQLTARNKNQENAIPMCGIPFHAYENYLNKLTKAGVKVAICEQVEEPGKGKKLLKRDIVRIITPGTAISPDVIQANQNCYICSIYPDITHKKIGISFCDLSTGEFEAESYSLLNETSKVIETLLTYSPKEILLPLSKTKAITDWIDTFIENLNIGSSIPNTPEFINNYHFDYDRNNELLNSHFKTVSLASFDLDSNRATISAAGALLTYLQETQKDQLSHITLLKRIQQFKYMMLDESTIRNLEVFNSNQNNTEENSLIEVIDQTQTPMGGRLIRNWIKRPLLDFQEIQSRLEAVEEGTQKFSAIEQFRSFLKGIGDIERVISRISMPIVGVLDFIRLRDSIRTFPTFEAPLKNFKSPRITQLREKFDPLQDITKTIETYMLETPHLKLKEGGYINTGLNERLDYLRDLTKNAKSHIAALETKERKNTKINALKVKFNRVFGYYFEVSNAVKHLVPEHYIRRQTLVNGERYITEELKELEESIISAESESQILEQKFFNELVQKVIIEINRIKISTKIIAEIDTLFSLSHVAIKNNYTKPSILLNGKKIISIEKGRHPVIEKIQKEETFISNDLNLNEENQRIIIITGPNMGGKSTYMRQVALISLLFQIGSFVPADKAILPVFDRIFTRVGASDNLSKGQSTFMLEMNEAAVILNNATKNSLVILDEIGRGTSTYDGISIAWSIVQQLHKLKCFTLFATHYHELTTLDEELPALKNFSVLVKEEENKIVFLKKIAAGKANKSYGIHVAKLAGLPKEVIESARNILKKLEKENENKRQVESNDLVEENKDSFYEKPFEKNKKKEKDNYSNEQMSFLSPDSPFIDEIKQFDLLNSSPLEAIQFISNLQKKITK